MFVREIHKEAAGGRTCPLTLYMETAFNHIPNNANNAQRLPFSEHFLKIEYTKTFGETVPVYCENLPEQTKNTVALSPQANYTD
jgi:hypothetical protein